MVLQYYQNLKEMTSNVFHNFAFGVGFKCPRKIHLNTQWGGQKGKYSALLRLILVEFLYWKLCFKLLGDL